MASESPLVSLKSLLVSPLIIESNHKEKIPSINEVLDLMQEEWAAGLLLNIELKNSIVLYVLSPILALCFQVFCQYSFIYRN